MENREICGISAPKRTDAVLEEQKGFTLELVQHLAVPCFVLDRDHKVLVWNRACEALTGVTSTEVLGTDLQWRGFSQEKRPTLADIVLDGCPPTLYVQWEKSAHDENGLRCEGWHRGVGGKDRYLVSDAFPVRDGKGETIAVVETLHDLTERKNVEGAMAKSEEKFYRTFQACPDGMFINTRLEGVFIEVNDAFVQMLEYGREEIIGHSSAELNLWPDPQQRALIVEQTRETGEVRNVEVNIRIKSGLIRTFLWSTDVIRINERDCLIGCVRDVTDLKKKERQLVKKKEELARKHEELSLLFGRVESAKKEWETTMDCISDMIILLDPEGRVKRCNRAAMEFMDMPFEQILGQDLQRLSAQAGIPLPPITAAFNIHCYELHVEAPDIWLAVTCYPGKDGGERTADTVLTIHNITEQKRAAIELFQAYKELKEAQSQIIAQEKMASLGQLAAGVAHEINNPTGYIISNLGTLDKYQARLVEFINSQNEIIGALDPSELQSLATIRKRLKVDHIVGDMPALISESMDGAKRIQNIVKSLRGFSRKDDDKCTTASITECLESAINIVWNQIKYHATLHKEFGEVPEIRCYPQKLSQVFMNLIVNAAHALGEKGEITVSTWQENDAAYISVADTGSGIPEETLSQIFEPFFTTKEVGKGTGLGLSISREIVRAHGGEITVESSVGTGTTFTVILPLNGVKGCDAS